MSELPSVAIIIVNWNGLNDTRACLQSLQKLNYPDYNIILVDNGSSDGSVTFFSETYPEIEIIALKANEGFTGGNNAGMRKALDRPYDYVLLLNNDTVCPKADFLSTMVEACEADSKIGMACPTIYYDDPPGKVWYAGAKLSMATGWKHHHTKPDSNNVQSTGYATGCCLLVRTQTIKDIGQLNSAYFLSVEDVEWSKRARQAGWKTVYIPGPSIIHKDSASSRSSGKGFFSPTRIYYESRNRIWFIREYAHPFQKVVLWSVRFFLYYLYKVSAYTLLGRWQKLKAITKGMRDGIFTKSSCFKIQ